MLPLNGWFGSERSDIRRAATGGRSKPGPRSPAFALIELDISPIHSQNTGSPPRKYRRFSEPDSIDTWMQLLWRAELDAEA